MRTLAALLLLAGAGVLPLHARAAALPAPPQTAGRTLELREFHSSIVVRRNGSIRVTENLTVHFAGAWNGIYRVIPVEYRTNQGLNYTLRLQVIGATDNAGNTLRLEQDRDGGSLRLKMYVPGAIDVTRTISLTYEVQNALRFFEEHDELYWNVTGHEWDFPIQSVRADIVLPGEVSGVRTAAFAGARGSTASGIAQEQVANGVYFRSSAPLGYHEGMTVVVGWNPGVIARPSAVDRASSLFASNALMLVPVLALGIMWLLWRR
jgi:hypothetical protein